MAEKFYNHFAYVVSNLNIPPIIVPNNPENKPLGLLFLPSSVTRKMCTTDNEVTKE